MRYVVLSPGDVRTELKCGTQLMLENCLVVLKNTQNETGVRIVAIIPCLILNADPVGECYCEVWGDISYVAAKPTVKCCYSFMLKCPFLDLQAFLGVPKF